MLLCIDIGNTNIKLGLFEGEQMCCHWRIATDRSRLADEYAILLVNLLATSGKQLSDVSGCAISSVVPSLTPEFVELAQRYIGIDPIIPGAGRNTGIEIHTDYPAEVGMDLVMNALAARKLYGTPVIIVGFGTATTFSAVSAAGHFEGVAIAPGIITSMDSLFRAASTLPRLALVRPEAAIGKNTIQSMRSGIVYGFASLVEGIVERIKGELGGSAWVVATGGLAELIAPETRVIDTVEPNLALIGLRLLHELNRP